MGILVFGSVDEVILWDAETSAYSTLVLRNDSTFWDYSYYQFILFGAYGYPLNKCIPSSVLRLDSGQEAVYTIRVGMGAIPRPANHPRNNFYSAATDAYEICISGWVRSAVSLDILDADDPNDAIELSNLIFTDEEVTVNVHAPSDSPIFNVPDFSLDFEIFSAEE
jgi:hypothetical protein